MRSAPPAIRGSRARWSRNSSRCPQSWPVEPVPAAFRAWPDGLSNLDYAPLCEIMGRVTWSAEVFNCSAPDTGNMETIERYGTEAHKDRWLEPLLRGEIRSAFLMTEPAVASSMPPTSSAASAAKATSTSSTAASGSRPGSGIRSCKIFIVMGKTDRMRRAMRSSRWCWCPATRRGDRSAAADRVGYDDAPHGHMEVLLEDVRVPVENMLLGEGRGFEIAQGVSGPGRIHHCMRSIGAAERALEMMCDRLQSRTAFGSPLATQSVWHERIADSRCMIDQARLLTFNAARMMDVAGNKAARAEIAMIKVVAPNMSCKIVDWAIQAYGAAGLSADFWLAEAYAHQRTVRIVDGPDEVHRSAIAKIELGKRAAAAKAREAAGT